jgi:hypothetical protein
MSNVQEVRLKFQGTPLHALGWIAASVLGGLLCGAPLAWVNAALAGWFCRNTEFSDGSTAEFRGTGGEVVVWHVILFLAVSGQAALGGPVALYGLTFVLGVGVALMLLKWMVYNLRLTPGPQLTFTGSFAGLLGWSAALLLSLLTVVGWAWVAVTALQWAARNVKGEGIALEIRVTPVEFLRRGLATALGSLLIVTIPFLALWFTRWLIANVVLIRGVETEWGGFIEEQRTPQKPSWPAVPPLHRHID